MIGSGVFGHSTLTGINGSTPRTVPQRMASMRSEGLNSSVSAGEIQVVIPYSLPSA